MALGAKTRAALLLWLTAGCTATPPKAVSRPSQAVIPPPATQPAPPEPRAPPLPAPVQRVAELEAAGSIADRDARWARQKALVQRIRRLADPRSADPLAGYLSRHKDWKRSGELVHFQTEVALALAELGDLRALPVLAARLRLDPLKVYADDGGPETALRRDDMERAAVARSIVDLARLHPEALAKVRAVAEEPVYEWTLMSRGPRATGMRALAAMHTSRPGIVGQLRAWAAPSDPLPAPGAMPPFPESWVIAQSALRYVGALRDAKSWTILLQQLQRRPARLDVTMDALMRGRVAMLGMALRALGVGAANGLSEWGDARAFDPLLRYIDSDKDNEQSRRAACVALAWVLTEQDIAKLAKQITRLSRSGKKAARFKLGCLLGGLQERRVDGLTPLLLGLITAKVPADTRHAAARALGRHGLDAATERKLDRLLADPDLRVDAALALLLGGSRDAARHAVESLPVAEVTGELGELYRVTFGNFPDADFVEGHIYRWVDNARALTTLDLPAGAQRFAENILAHQFGVLLDDNGPHSLTRVVLRRRLFDAAQSGPSATRPEAVATLELMRERGTLLALADGKGTTAELAGEAVERLSSGSGF